MAKKYFCSGPIYWICIVVSFILCANVEAVTRTWDGGIDADTNWSTPNNWSGDTIPGTTDDVIFDGTSTENCTVNSAVTVASISVNSGYTGTITQSNTINVTVTGSFTQAAGTWSIGTSSSATTLTVNGTFNKTGGTIDAWGKGRIELNGAATFSGGVADFYRVTCSTGSNTTTINTVTVGVTGGGLLTIGTGTVTGTGQITLYDGASLSNSGTIDCKIRYETSWVEFSVYPTNYEALEILCVNGPARATLTGNITCTSLLLYHHTQAPDTFTLNTNGYSVTADRIYLDIGVGGVLKCKGSTIKLTNIMQSLYIASGCKVEADSSIWYVAGPISTEGLNTGTSTFVFTDNITLPESSWYNLTAGGKGKTLTLGGDCTVTNDLTISSGATLTQGDYALIVNGKIKNSGKLNTSLYKDNSKERGVDGK